MPALATNLRNDLGRVIVKARQVAEAGARKALDSLAVERHEPHGSMSPDERTLRNRLRARGRQLGDVRDRQRGTQSIDRNSSSLSPISSSMSVSASLSSSSGVTKCLPGKISM